MYGQTKQWSSWTIMYIMTVVIRGVGLTEGSTKSDRMVEHWA